VGCDVRKRGLVVGWRETKIGTKEGSFNTLYINCPFLHAYPVNAHGPDQLSQHSLQYLLSPHIGFCFSLTQWRVQIPGQFASSCASVHPRPESARRSPRNTTPKRRPVPLPATLRAPHRKVRQRGARAASLRLPCGLSSKLPLSRSCHLCAPRSLQLCKRSCL
jgi:hypothetical protein